MRSVNLRTSQPNSYPMPVYSFRQPKGLDYRVKQFTPNQRQGCQTIRQVREQYKALQVVRAERARELYDRLRDPETINVLRSMPNLETQKAINIMTSIANNGLAIYHKGVLSANGISTRVTESRLAKLITEQGLELELDLGVPSILRHSKEQFEPGQAKYDLSTGSLTKGNVRQYISYEKLKELLGSDFGKYIASLFFDAEMSAEFCRKSNQLRFENRRMRMSEDDLYDAFEKAKISRDSSRRATFMCYRFGKRKIETKEHCHVDFSDYEIRILFFREYVAEKIVGLYPLNGRIFIRSFAEKAPATLIAFNDAHRPGIMLRGQFSTGNRTEYLGKGFSIGDVIVEKELAGFNVTFNLETDSTKKMGIIEKSCNNIALYLAKHKERQAMLDKIAAENKKLAEQARKEMQARINATEPKYIKENRKQRKKRKSL